MLGHLNTLPDLLENTIFVCWPLLFGQQPSTDGSSLLCSFGHLDTRLVALRLWLGAVVRVLGGVDASKRRYPSDGREGRRGADARALLVLEVFTCSVSVETVILKQ